MEDREDALIYPQESDIGRAVRVTSRGWPSGRRGIIKRLDESYVWVLFDDETEFYRGELTVRACIRSILCWVR